MSVREDIAARLTAAFAPVVIEVEDESRHHAGHAGARPGGETHFRVHIVAEAFGGLSRLERHRRVNAALAPVFAAGLHALAIEADAPPAGRGEAS